MTLRIALARIAIWKIVPWSSNSFYVSANAMVIPNTLITRWSIYCMVQEGPLGHPRPWQRTDLEGLMVLMLRSGEKVGEKVWEQMSLSQESTWPPSRTS